MSRATALLKQDIESHASRRRETEQSVGLLDGLPAIHTSILSLQRRAGNRAVAATAESVRIDNGAGTIPPAGREPAPAAQRCACGGVAGPDGECARCRSRRLAAARRASGNGRISAQAAPHLRTRPALQRMPTNGARLTTATSEQAGSSAALIVEDDVASVAPGQMQKSRFLAELRVAVCAAAEEVLAATARTTAGCPYLEFWFGYYARRDAAQIARAINRYAPEAASARSARDLIPPIVERVRRSVTIWAQTGEISGIPEGALTEKHDARNGEGSVQAAQRGAEGLHHGNLHGILARLGHGRPLDAASRGRLEPVFGRDFAGVRLHTDANAASLADELNARAFTLGEHVALGAGEYRPGTLAGDALLAHELAHVVQQEGRPSSVSPLQMGTPEYGALEQEADATAAGAVFSLLTGMTARVPRRRSGLTLQRCSTERCPPGFKWTPVNRAAAAPACICTWACKPSRSGGGPAIEHPNRRRPSMPSPRRGTGAPIQRGLDPDVYCGCHPLRDSEGNIIGTDIGAPADFDVQQAMPGRTGRAIGELGGRPTTPPPTEAPRPAVVGPAQAGTRPPPPSRPSTAPRPQVAPPPEPPQATRPPEPPEPAVVSEPARPAGVPEPSQPSRPAEPAEPAGPARPPAPKPLTKQEFDKLSWRERQDYLDAWMKARGIERIEKPNDHHAWPMYLGGPKNGPLIPLDEQLHRTFHNALNKELPTKLGAAHYASLSPAEKAKNIQKLKQVARDFDVDFNTKIYERLLKALKGSPYEEPTPTTP
jgi:hypothetical protein